MIEDTSFVIDILGGDRDALQTLEGLESDRVPEKLSAVTVLELHEGIARSDYPSDECDQVRTVLDSKTVIPADASVMERAGSISGELYEAGEPIDREDCIVAATALAEDEPVLTRNVEHFRRISELDVRTY